VDVTSFYWGWIADKSKEGLGKPHCDMRIYKALKKKWVD